MHITSTELGKVTASDGFVLGASAGHSITVNGMLLAGSTHLSPVVTLVAKNALAQVVFETSGSTFTAVEVQGSPPLSRSRCIPRF